MFSEIKLASSGELAPFTEPTISFFLQRTKDGLDVALSVCLRDGALAACCSGPFRFLERDGAAAEASSLLRQAVEQAQRE